MNNEPRPYHIPVLIKEVIEYLNIQPGGVYIDATFGGGGHTRAILSYEPTCHVIAFDWDLKALEQAESLMEEFPGRLTLVWANFSLIEKKLKELKYDKVDGILADFGTSQFQLHERAGFSFNSDTPLDMRMSPSHQKITAAEIINKGTENTLREIFEVLGEEPRAKALAKAIVLERVKKPITTTKQLANLVEKIIPRLGKKIHPATKVFQALRMYVNKELDNINALLKAGIRVVANGGRIVCITFHSLEDRLVKQFFKQQHDEEGHAAVTTRVVIPAEQEVAENPASRSAKLRVLQICKDV